MFDLLVGALALMLAGFTAAGYYDPPQWIVAGLFLSVGLRLFATGLSKQVDERHDREFGRTIEEYRAYKKDLRDRNG